MPTWSAAACPRFCSGNPRRQTVVHLPLTIERPQLLLFTLGFALSCFVIPTGAARLFLSRRSLARRAAQRVLCASCASPGWRDLAAAYPLAATVTPNDVLEGHPSFAHLECGGLPPLLQRQQAPANRSSSPAHHRTPATSSLHSWVCFFLRTENCKLRTTLVPFQLVSGIYHQAG